MSTIEKEGESIALLWLSAVHYYTGQLFDIEKITLAAQKKVRQKCIWQKSEKNLNILQGCTVGWDLAHAAGNVPMKLHDWNVDFAAWCSYKYLNSAPGGLGVIFVHERHAKNDYPKFSGWWSDDKEHRMNMTNGKQILFCKELC